MRNEKGYTIVVNRKIINMLRKGYEYSIVRYVYIILIAYST